MDFIAEYWVEFLFGGLATVITAICNPVIVVSVIASVWTAVTDPTTKGTSDSQQALTYNVPKQD